MRSARLTAKSATPAGVAAYFFVMTSVMRKPLNV
jgi:hypothetical protein